LPLPRLKHATCTTYLRFFVRHEAREEAMTSSVRRIAPLSTLKVPGGANSEPGIASRSSSPSPARVIVVDNDQLYAETLTLQLSERGFSVRHFAEAEALLAALDEVADADVILLDWHMPRVSGIDLLSALRRRGIKLPVAFLTGSNSVEYESHAFDCGARDFVDKSRGLEVLVARLRRIIAAPIAGGVEQGHRGVVTGKLALYRDASRATWDGVDVPLTAGEYNIVELLVLDLGNYVSYRAIDDVMRAPGFVSASGPKGYRTNVRSTIKRMRNKFRALDPTFAEIESYSAFGYRWRAQ
jgi:two-component system response regulator ChvI